MCCKSISVNDNGIVQLFYLMNLEKLKFWFQCIKIKIGNKVNGLDYKVLEFKFDSEWVGKGVFIVFCQVVINWKFGQWKYNQFYI